MRASGTVWAVPCVDTEGPLTEPLDATFERIKARFGLELPASAETLARLQRQDIPLGGREAEVAHFVDPQRLGYLPDWAAVEAMVQRVTSAGVRAKYHDSAGQPYVFSWFVIDVVGYRDNPRQKAAGFHAVWDRYARMLQGQAAHDGLGWHFHTVPVGQHALDYNACWTNNDWHEQALARRLIERRSFPAIFRAGGTIERDDLSHWLEQFIPFDYSSAAVRDGGGGRPGQLWDWRGAPPEWRPYHPDWYDYRRRGAMKRWVFRCLEISGYESPLGEEDVRDAFALAASGQDAVLAFSNHDRRDLEPDMAKSTALLGRVGAEFPGVPWRFANALTAAQNVTGGAVAAPVNFRTRWENDLLWIESDQPLCGAIPFLAVEEEGDVFYRDNPTIEGPQRWAYVPVRRARVRRIGIAGNNAAGATGVAVIELR
jgi:hypothetical protein